MSRSRPRVALVAHDVSGQQGSGRVIRELVLRAHEEIDFVIVSRGLADDLRSLVEWRRAPAPDRPYRLKFSAFFLTGALRLALTRADLVHLHTTGPLVPNRSDLTSVHFIRAGFFEAAEIFGPNGISRRRRISPRLHLALERWCNRRARMLAAVSEGSKRDLERFFPGIPVIVSPNGVDADRFRPDLEARHELRAAEGISAEDVVALLVANSWSQKGLGVTIEALALAGTAALQLWVVGYGDEGRYSALAEAHGVRDRVRFFGLRRDIERFYQAADLFVLPSLYEQASLAAWEAAASGLPVVATPVSGMAEIVGDEEGGLLVARDPDAVGRGLARLASDAELRRRMGGEARRLAAGYTWQRSVESILAAYRDLLGSRL